jgi:hypothetical protein
MHEAGKGDTPRPLSVDPDTFAKNWDAIFGKKEAPKEIEEEILDKPKDSEQGG